MTSADDFITQVEEITRRVAGAASKLEAEAVNEHNQARAVKLSDPPTIHQIASMKAHYERSEAFRQGMGKLGAVATALEILLDDGLDDPEPEPRVEYASSPAAEVPVPAAVPVTDSVERRGDGDLLLTIAPGRVIRLRVQTLYADGRRISLVDDEHAASLREAIEFSEWEIGRHILDECGWLDDSARENHAELNKIAHERADIAYAVLEAVAHSNTPWRSAESCLRGAMATRYGPRSTGREDDNGAGA